MDLAFTLKGISICIKIKHSYDDQPQASKFLKTTGTCNSCSSLSTVLGLTHSIRERIRTISNAVQ